jgi:hypothetical protein
MNSSYSSSFESDSDNEPEGSFEVIDKMANKSVVNFKTLFPAMQHTYGTQVKEPNARDFSLYQR